MQLPQLPQLDVKCPVSPTLRFCCCAARLWSRIAKHGADGLHLQLHTLHLVDDHLTLLHLCHIPIFASASPRVRRTPRHIIPAASCIASSVGPEYRLRARHLSPLTLILCLCLAFPQTDRQISHSSPRRRRRRPATVFKTAQLTPAHPRSSSAARLFPHEPRHQQHPTHIRIHAPCAWRCAAAWRTAA